MSSNIWMLPINVDIPKRWKLLEDGHSYACVIIEEACCSVCTTLLDDICIFNDLKCLKSFPHTKYPLVQGATQPQMHAECGYIYESSLCHKWKLCIDEHSLIHLLRICHRILPWHTMNLQMLNMFTTFCRCYVEGVYKTKNLIYFGLVFLYLPTLCFPFTLSCCFPLYADFLSLSSWPCMCNKFYL